MNKNFIYKSIYRLIMVIGILVYLIILPCMILSKAFAANYTVGTCIQYKFTKDIIKIIQLSDTEVVIKHLDQLYKNPRSILDKQLSTGQAYIIKCEIYE